MFNKDFNTRFKAAVRSYLWRGRPSQITGRKVKEQRWELKIAKRRAVRMAKKFAGGGRLSNSELRLVLAPFRP